MTPMTSSRRPAVASSGPVSLPSPDSLAGYLYAAADGGGCSVNSRFRDTPMVGLPRTRAARIPVPIARTSLSRYTEIIRQSLCPR